MNPFLKAMKDAKAKMDSLLNKAKTENRVFTEAENTEFDSFQKEFNDANAMADKFDVAVKAGKSIVEPELDDDGVPGNRIDVNDKSKGPFKNFTQQLVAVRNAANGRIDERLNVVNAALGMSEGSGADGGFAVQTDFAGMLMDTAVKEDPLLSLVDTYGVSAGSNSVEWVEIDEKGDVSTTVFGGVQVYWDGEAGEVTAAKPALKTKKLDLVKLMGMAYATYELNQDSNFVEQLYSRAFQVAIRKKLAAAIFSGTGVGMPLGILNSPALVSVSKESGQVASTINWENISKMYHRALDKSGMIWAMHPDAHGQLDFLEFAVGTGGVPVYLPATQQGTVDMMRGKRIVESDNCSALGTAGDILFIDPKQYVLIYKGGVQKDVSIHVQFLTAENAFRFIYRANGMPKVSQAMKIKNSSDKRSPYIAIATRS